MELEDLATIFEEQIERQSGPQNNDSKQSALIGFQTLRTEVEKEYALAYKIFTETMSQEFTSVNYKKRTQIEATRILETALRGHKRRIYDYITKFVR